MLDALAERQCQILRRVHLPQGGGCANGQLREIHAASLTKYKLQFGDGER